MSYDLYGWPVDRPMTKDEAIDEIERRMRRISIGLGRDRRLDAFAKAMDDQYPGLGTEASPLPIELDVHRHWVFMALPWTMVADVVTQIAPIAYSHGIALFDPQRREVALPAPFGDSPMDVAGTDDHERAAANAFGLIIQGLATGTDDPIAAVQAPLRAAGYRAMSPLGFEITPDIADEVFRDPTRMPSSLQTDERRVQLTRDLGHSRTGKRHEALIQLSAWDPDPEVRAALRPLLDDDDAFVVGIAGQGLARQRNVDDLPALLSAVQRLSPADGGSLDAMLMPLQAAIELAKVAGPHALADAKARAREWRNAAGTARSRSMLDEEFERILDNP